MRTLILSILMLALALGSLHAQDLNIHKTDGTTITIPLNTIDSITFSESGSAFECGVSTVTDVDGNVYNTVLIGEQCWMKENLKTTLYRDGTPIDNPINNSDWQNNTIGAYAWYNNNSGFKDSYGALYNWYAGVNANGLCPDGWHLPADDEWTQLVDYVAAQGFPNENISNGTGNALKSCRQVNSPLGGDCNTAVHPRWDSNNTHYGFDEFGFSAFPGGARDISGVFGFIGAYGTWWTSTEYPSSFVYYRHIGFSYGNVGHDSLDKGTGFSVRCIKD